MAKTTHTSTGQSPTVSSRYGISYYVVFNNGSTGSVQLQMLVNDEWLPAAAAITGDTSVVTHLAVDRGSNAQYRFNCTSVDGSITTYLE